jgi:hypothetical protein
VKKTLETKPQLIQISPAWNSREGAPTQFAYIASLSAIEADVPSLLDSEAVCRECEELSHDIVSGDY